MKNLLQQILKGTLHKMLNSVQIKNTPLFKIAINTTKKLNTIPELNL